MSYVLLYHQYVMMTHLVVKCVCVCVFTAMLAMLETIQVPCLQELELKTGNYSTVYNIYPSVDTIYKNHCTNKSTFSTFWKIPYFQHTYGIHIKCSICTGMGRGNHVQRCIFFVQLIWIKILKVHKNSCFLYPT